MAGDGRFLEGHFYWVGLDFKLITAISVSPDDAMAALPVQIAEEELRTEFAEWAKVADKL